MYPPQDAKMVDTKRDNTIWKIDDNEREYLLKRLALSGAERTKLYMVNCWIENDDEGFTGWRWEKFKRTRRIVSACNRYKDVLICAPRHSCPIMTMTSAFHGGMDVLHEYAGDDHDQGFVDQYGTFFTREEAYKLAVENGQLLYPERVTPGTLFSEGLY